VFASSRITVTDVATLIFPSSVKRQAVIVRNLDDTDSIKLGGVTVTYNVSPSSDGFSLLPGEAMSFTSDQFVRESKASLYGIADTSVSVLVEVLSHDSSV
jgi:hypothetical protein